MSTQANGIVSRPPESPHSSSPLRSVTQSRQEILQACQLPQLALFNLVDLVNPPLEVLAGFHTSHAPYEQGEVGSVLRFAANLGAVGVNMHMCFKSDPDWNVRLATCKLLFPSNPLLVQNLPNHHLLTWWKAGQMYRDLEASWRSSPVSTQLSISLDSVAVSTTQFSRTTDSSVERLKMGERTSTSRPTFQSFHPHLFSVLLAVQFSLSVACRHGYDIAEPCSTRGTGRPLQAT
ncbi:hypothetical protein BDP81DRAFT_502564 [Colletotrichum phormii]|uniref:Uncharacterized protein n=1 Tax=Colletotrichum phormii TaxID=359342 RepID=A0AAI9ZFR4_9PEZI|nr:uncharacterized protein BDP81DRAFT_502564 [Colletotrichum phormii]KAK1623705.1 hypothetical protein BDP81DRAFT_502564 [Colletotrichum phormii]